MLPLIRGRYTIRAAQSPEDVRRAQQLRTLAFATPALDRDAHDDQCTHVLDRDAHDDQCTHVLVEDGADLVACMRMMILTPARVDESYSAQFYDLGRLRDFTGPLAELGRFCLSPLHHDPDILRAAWAGVTALVEGAGAGMLMGCSSFRGTDPARYADAFALLARSHLAPDRWRPGVRAAEVFDFVSGAGAPDQKRALQGLPPLLRTYLAMGGWVSDHAVVDHAMNTLHVFTGLEVGLIPPGRARLLRASAG